VILVVRFRSLIIFKRGKRKDKRQTLKKSVGYQLSFVESRRLLSTPVEQTNKTLINLTGWQIQLAYLGCPLVVTEKAIVHHFDRP